MFQVRGQVLKNVKPWCATPAVTSPENAPHRNAPPAKIEPRLEWHPYFPEVIFETT